MAIQNKRFIAGAKCPKCKAIDSIMLFVQDGVEQLECIECGYHESQDDLGTDSAVTEDETLIGVFKPG